MKKHHENVRENTRLSDALFSADNYRDSPICLKNNGVKGERRNRSGYLKEVSYVTG